MLRPCPRGQGRFLFGARHGHGLELTASKGAARSLRVSKRARIAAAHLVAALRQELADVQSLARCDIDRLAGVGQRVAGVDEDAVAAGRHFDRETIAVELRVVTGAIRVHHDAHRRLRGAANGRDLGILALPARVQRSAQREPQSGPGR